MTVELMKIRLNYIVEDIKVTCIFNLSFTIFRGKNNNHKNNYNVINTLGTKLLLLLFIKIKKSHTYT